MLISCTFWVTNVIKSVDKKKKFGRKHGGIAVYVHESILGGVSRVPTPGSESIILK